MPAFEITAIGFDGATDETDSRVLWVWCESEQWLRNSLKGTWHETMIPLEMDNLLPDQFDFIMPKDVQALHDRLRALAGIPRLDQVVRGTDYKHVLHGRVTAIAPHPSDGAFWIVEQCDVEDDTVYEERPYFGCEASALRFLPAGENQKP